MFNLRHAELLILNDCTFFSLKFPTVELSSWLKTLVKEALRVIKSHHDLFSCKVE